MDEELTPESYPATCTVSKEDLQRLYEKFHDPDDGYGERVGEWPVTDANGNVFPIFYTPDELTDDGGLYGNNYTKYRPFTGQLAPRLREKGKYCNAPLNKWRKRYHQIRYCGRTALHGKTFCSHHRNRINPTDSTMGDTAHDDIDSAEEMLQTGLFTTTIDHFYDDLDPLKKLAGWGAFESLMGESSYEFAIEYEPKEFDFSEAEMVPPSLRPQLDDDGETTVLCGYPTQNVDPALSLYVAAMMGIQMITVQPRIMYENESEGERMMESKTIETAQLTAPPTEHDPSPQEFKTLETWTEHHLNLPLSRLVTDRPKLLERGGVGVEAGDSNDTVSEDDIVLEIQADPDNTETTEGGTDPNAFSGMEAESEKIVEKASDE